MTRIGRRRFLSCGVMAGGTLAFSGLARRIGPGASNSKHLSNYKHLVAKKGSGGYSPLQPTRANNTGETLLALPAGFQYTVLGKTGAPMSDKNPTPGRHDGMAAFAAGDSIRLVRNHEINNRLATTPLALGDKSKSYDSLAGGGTVTLVVDPKTRELVRDFISLSGTLQNCAGGPTPWGSWITCEETVLGRKKFADLGGFEKSHGYCFEVPAAANSQVAAVPLKQMGRFVHEAIAVDPATSIVYLTEDQGASGFYRFIPKNKKALVEGGRLQMLAIKDRAGYDTRTAQKVGASLPATWVDIADPDPGEADTNPLAVYNQGIGKGGATFARLEGCWYGNGKIFINSTSGGDKRLGQVWQYQPSGEAAGLLTLLFESPSADLLDGPDNICVSPRGGLVVCEDGRDSQYIRGITGQGLIFDFAMNTVPGFEMSEFAGATFSPDGETLFVNIQTPGLTLAIWGPWKDGAL